MNAPFVLYSNHLSKMHACVPLPVRITTTTTTAAYWVRIALALACIYLFGGHFKKSSNFARALPTNCMYFSASLRFPHPNSQSALSCRLIGCFRNYGQKTEGIKGPAFSHYPFVFQFDFHRRFFFSRRLTISVRDPPSTLLKIFLVINFPPPPTLISRLIKKKVNCS